MAKKLSTIAKQLALTPAQLKKKVIELGFELNSDSIDNELAELIKDELNKHPVQEEKSHIDQYDEFFEHEREKEIIKKQRKQTAGKEKKAEKAEVKVVIEEQRKMREFVEIPGVISVKEFSEKCAISPAKVIGELMKNGILANINQQIDFDTALIIADELGITIKKIQSEVSFEDLFERNLENLLKEDDPKLLVERSPVVSVMGHVDHGKTKLLDAIRETNVVEQEAGGITQHIGAYQVVKNGKKITFIDTPGHEAFTAMRARGAKATDIAILVVAADEGVKPQTIEAINHAKEAHIPIIVTINKTDKEGANIERVKAQLAEIGLQPEDWGGDTIMIPISALRKEGFDNLLANILVVAELAHLQANPQRAAVATVLETDLNTSLGPTATVIVNTGTLHLMDNVVVGAAFGRIKVMLDHKGERIQFALPSTPVKIAGLSQLPQMGDILQVVKDEKTARSQALKIQTLQQTALFNKGLGIEEITAQINKGDLKVLKLVLKADTKGSLEAIKQTLSGIPSEKARAQIIHSGIGNISESDILMAEASRGIVIGFNVNVSPIVAKIAERQGVQIFSYKVIYELIDNVTKLLSGLLEPEEFLIELGKAEIKQIFYSKRNETIIGCKIIDGKVERKAKLRVKRADDEIGSGIIESLKRAAEDVTEMQVGSECGIRFVGKCQLAIGDILEAYKIEKRKSYL